MRRKRRAGLTVAGMRGDERAVAARGVAPDAVVELGSITKVVRATGAVVLATSARPPDGAAMWLLERLTEAAAPAS